MCKYINSILKRISSRVVPFVLAVSAALVVSTVTAFAADFNEVLKNGLDQKLRFIDVSSLDIAPQDAIDTFQDFIENHPEYYYVNSEVKCTYNGSKAAKLEVTYNVSGDEQDFDQIVNKIVQGASQCSGDYAKVKYVHDYLVENSSYDYTFSKFSAYDVIVGKSGVCQAYASAFKLIMDKLGIDCSYAKSSNMQHMWNVVKVDGKWYHIDCAWSNTARIPGQPVSEAYMLKSSSFFSIVGYYDWTIENGVTCTDTKYDSNF